MRFKFKTFHDRPFRRRVGFDLSHGRVGSPVRPVPRQGHSVEPCFGLPAKTHGIRSGFDRCVTDEGSKRVSVLLLLNFDSRESHRSSCGVHDTNGELRLAMLGNPLGGFLVP